VSIITDPSLITPLATLQWLDQPFPLLPGITQTILYPHGFQIEVTLSTNNTIVVSTGTTTTHGTPDGVWHLGRYFTVDLEYEDHSISAVLTIVYDKTTLGSVNASALHFVCFNASTNQWQTAPLPSSVNIDLTYVQQATTHFSEWTVVGGAPSSGSKTNTKTIIIVSVIFGTIVLGGFACCVFYRIRKRRAIGHIELHDGGREALASSDDTSDTNSLN